MNRIKSLLILSFLFLLAACDSLLFDEEPAGDARAIFEYLWQSFDEDYGPFEARGVDWQEMYDKYSPQVTATTTQDELYAVVTAMLSELDDGHVQLSAPDRPVFSSNRYFRERIGDELFNLDVVKEYYLTEGYLEGAEESYVYGLLSGNVLYIYFPYVAENWPALDEALDKYPDAAGLIVDLRHNSGGDFTWAYSEMGRLVDEKRLVFRSRTKNGPGRGDFTPWHDWHLEPEGSFFNRPVVALTDRYTISAGERAAMAFKVLPHATMVGDTTNGAHSTAIGRDLANGWHHFIPTQEVTFVDGKTYEGIGIIPDIYVQNTEAELEEGQDRVLEKALSLF